ncbi:hypothetical protein COU74_05400 [Candidatus Peregrinibacteria bacterium CG10_big_fil_rev_8_21_14_0_10_36_19]|nr:MAG: hypothetical protein COU74_05400 [Candidatus Peregrinibacteria bacterium CG10_big_fil_rev_8_21_14_0_10_36_19]
MVKNIVILGAGFAGLKVTQDLTKKLKDPNYNITLIEKSDVHLYRADLYEVATAFNQKITKECLTKLRNTIATPITELVDTNRVKLIKDEVVKIKSREILLKKGKPVKYDYLVVALGSITNYFKIPGLEKYSLPLKDIQDGIAINCHLDQHLQSLWEKKSQKEVNIVIGGGGATGVETATELTSAYKKLCKKYDYPYKKIHIHIIEGQKMLGGMDAKGTKIIKARLKELNVKVHFKSFITKVTAKEITIKDAPEKLPYDILIWTGGVKSNPVVGSKPIEVRPTLQSKDAPSIFAAGDNAFYPDPQNPKQRLPMLARTAFDQGSLIAENIIRNIKGKKLKNYKHASLIYILPLGGRFALLKTQKHLISGRLIWYLRRLIFLKYSLAILPFWKGLRKWAHGTKIFTEND